MWEESEHGLTTGKVRIHRGKIIQVFGVTNWPINHRSAVVKHVERQSSDYNLLYLTQSKKIEKKKEIFILIKDGLES